MTKNSLLAEVTFKDAAPEIAIHLANIINLSIKLVTFPLQCKTAKRKTLFKMVIKTEARNYRPISVAFHIDGDRKIHSGPNAGLSTNQVEDQIILQK